MRIKLNGKEYKVIHLSFAKADFKEIGLEKAIELRLKAIAQDYDIQLEGESYVNLFENLIKALSKETQVVILIDEYDKPIIEYLGKDEIPQAQKNRDMLKIFYSVIKDLDRYIRFFLITGVSKFSKVSIFSDLNNLLDITMSAQFATLLGYTQAELEQYFEPYIAHISQDQAINREDLLTDLRKWYNGYDFAGRGNEKVYNPFSILSFMFHQHLGSYWFSTGTPTFLIKMLREKGLYDITKEAATDIVLSNFEIDHLDVTTLLFQTGYLTIQQKIAVNAFELGYPNEEVKQAMHEILLAEYSHSRATKTQPLVFKIKKAFEEGAIELIFEHLNSLFASIPYDIFEESRESYYHSIIFLTFSLLGYYIQAEVHTSKGRIDAVVQNADSIFILEFKIDESAKSALEQIKARDYAQQYQSEQKSIFLIGVACQDKEIKEYLIEQLKP